MCNKVCCRSMLVLRLLAAMGVMFVLEQPCHALTGGLESLRRFQELISDLVLVDSCQQFIRFCKFGTGKGSLEPVTINPTTYYEDCA